jgi:hypothetical protein
MGQKGFQIGNLLEISTLAGSESDIHRNAKKPFWEAASTNQKKQIPKIKKGCLKRAPASINGFSNQKNLHSFFQGL